MHLVDNFTHFSFKIIATHHDNMITITAFYFDIWEVEEIQGAIHNEKYKIICINDTDEDGKFSEYDQKIHQAFQSKFPEKSSFEL